MVAGASAAGAVIPMPGLPFAVEAALLKHEVNFYNSQLGLPEENSDDFRRLTLKTQEKVRKISAAQIKDLLAGDNASCIVEEIVRFIPLVGGLIAGSIAFPRIYRFLHQYLNELEETALALLDELTTIVVDDMDLDWASVGTENIYFYLLLLCFYFYLSILNEKLFSISMDNLHNKLSFNLV